MAESREIKNTLYNLLKENNIAPKVFESVFSEIDDIIDKLDEANIIADYWMNKARELGGKLNAALCDTDYLHSAIRQLKTESQTPDV
jgi:hypothetical protein